MSGIGGFNKGNESKLRWMRFVDGENLALQGAKILQRQFGPECFKNSPEYFEPGSFLWFPSIGCSGLTNHHLSPHWRVSREGCWNNQASEAIRAYYYTVISGTDEKFSSVEDRIWNLGFAPKVFRKSKSVQKTTCVDFSISAEMLAAAYKDQFDVVEIWTGDADYIPLIEEVKRCGKVVVCCFFNEDHGLSSYLKKSCDRYCDISALFSQRWKVRLQASSPETASS